MAASSNQFSGPLVRHYRQEVENEIFLISYIKSNGSKWPFHLNSREYNSNCRGQIPTTHPYPIHSSEDGCVRKQDKKRGSLGLSSKQSHYREVPRWEIFMEQELRFGLDLDRLAALKKKGLGWLWATFVCCFLMSSGAKKNVNFFFKNIVASGP